MSIFGNKTKTFSNSSSTSKTTAWSPVQGTLTKGADIMNDYISNPGSNAVYGGKRVAPLSADTTRAITMLRKSGGATDSADFMRGIMGSGAGGMNPQVAAMQDQIRRQVMSQVASQFSNAGTVGGTTNQEVLSRGLADGMAQPLFAAYENDMGRKMQAASALPGIDQQRITNAIGAGGILDSYNQSKINADRQAFDERRTAPLKAWSEVFPMAQSLGTQFGTQTQDQNSTNVQKSGGGIGQQILGGLMMAGGLATGMPGLGTMAAQGRGLFGGNVGIAPWTYNVSQGA